MANNKDKDEKYTPEPVIKIIKQLLGVKNFSFDPFSSEEANTIVGAKVFFTKETDAFRTPWPKAKSFFCNPPYSRELMSPAIDRLIDQSRNFKRGAVLVHSSTSARWFHKLMDWCDEVWFPEVRINFWLPNGIQTKGNDRPSTVFIKGSKRKFVVEYKYKTIVIRY